MLLVESAGQSTCWVHAGFRHLTSLAGWHSSTFMVIVIGVPCPHAIQGPCRPRPAYNKSPGPWPCCGRHHERPVSSSSVSSWHEQCRKHAHHALPPCTAGLCSRDCSEGQCSQRAACQSGVSMGCPSRQRVIMTHQPRISPGTWHLGACWTAFLLTSRKAGVLAPPLALPPHWHRCGLTTGACLPPGRLQPCLASCTCQSLEQPRTSPQPRQLPADLSMRVQALCRPSGGSPTACPT